VLTAAHVVAPESGTRTAKIDGVPVVVKQTVRRLQVLLPPDESGASAGAPLEAAVQASDTALDLAVLTVTAGNLPFLDLGDSDALGVGDALDAVGFPFGDQVEIGKPAAALTTAPAPSVSRGTLSAVRGDEQGDRRYLQVTAGLNPGNSGGPIVDADGYLVGIANSVLRSRAGVGPGVGFGVPVNLVKRFLELHGLDSALRAHRLAAGALAPLEGKGLRIALPIGMTDTSPYRARVDTGQQVDGLAFRVDRVVSPWPLARLEAALVSEQAFEPFVASASSRSEGVQAPGGRMLVGRTTGTMSVTGGGSAEPGGTDARIEYAIAERGMEKVVARFVGPPYQLAYNASLIRSVLRQMEVDRLRPPAVRLQAPASWMPRRTPRTTPLDGLSWPSGWLQEPTGPFACTGLPPAADVLSASPVADFTVALRAGWISSSAVTPQAAASACGGGRDEAGSYAGEASFLGAPYVVEGRFVPAEHGVLQLEWVAPADQAAPVRAIFADWLAR
jgi:hypothetical protein